MACGTPEFRTLFLRIWEEHIGGSSAPKALTHLCSWSLALSLGVNNVLLGDERRMFSSLNLIPQGQDGLVKYLYIYMRGCSHRGQCVQISLKWDRLVSIKVRLRWSPLIPASPDAANGLPLG